MRFMMRCAVVKGMMALLSLDMPMVLPFSSSTPTIKKSRPSTEKVLPSTSLVPNSFVASSVPTTATALRFSMSESLMNRPCATLRERMVS